MRKVLILVACLALGVASSARAEPPDAKTSARTDAYGDPLPPGAIARLGTIRLRHGGQIGSVAFSPDGKILASGAADNLVKLWDASTGKEIDTLKGHTHTVWSVAFSQDGKLLASGSADKTVKLWDISKIGEGEGEKGRVVDGNVPIFTLEGHTRPIRCVAFSPNGKTLISGCEDATIKIWDLTQWRGGVASGGMLSRPIDGGSKVKATSGRESMAPNKPSAFTLRGHRGRIFSLAFSSDGKTLASGSDDKILKLWDLTSRQEKASWQAHDDALVAVALSPNGRMLASGGTEGILKLWDLTTLQAGRVNSPVLNFKAHDDWVFSLAFSPDGKTLASGSWDETIKLWDTGRLTRPGRQAGGRAGNVNSPVRTLEGHTADINTVAFSPDGKTLASGGEDQVIKLWDVDTGKAKVVPKLQFGNEVSRGHAGPVTCLTFGPKGPTLATGAADRTVKLWDVLTREEKATFRMRGRVYSTAFSQDGHYLASTVDRMVSLWNIASSKEQAIFGGHIGPVRSAFSADGRTLASAGIDRTVKLWDSATGKQKVTLSGPIKFHSVAFSPDGKRIAAGGEEGTVKLWDVATGREWASMTHGDDWIISLVFSPDGKTLAASQGYDDVMLWDVATAKARGSLPRLNGTWGVAFSPDGKMLACGGNDKIVDVWDLSKSRLGMLSRPSKSKSNVWYRNGRQNMAPAIRPVFSFAGHLAPITSVAFSPDGSMLASSSDDTTVLLWDVARAKDAQEQPISPLGSDAVTACWNDLAGEDAVKAYQAIWSLVSAPGQAIPLFQRRLRPAPRPDPKRMARLVVDLDSNDFSARANASEELEKLHDLAGPLLRQQLTKQLSLEARRRVEQLLEKIDGPVTAPEQLRAFRAIEVLEYIATSESREVLKSVSKGDPEARLAIEAKASLKRLEKAGR